MRRAVVMAAMIAVACAAVPDVSAQMPMPAWVVPVVVKALGNSGTDWRSDVFITNLGPSTVTVGVHYFPADRANTFSGSFAKTLTLNPGQTVLARDVIQTWFPSHGSSTKGWLLIGDTTPVDCEDEDREMARLVVSDRVFNAASATSTYGQILEASWMTLNPGQVPSVLPGIRHQGKNAKPGMRTNIGVVNPTTATISVEISVFGASGALAGRATVSVPALSMGQWDLEGLSIQTLDSSGGRAELRLPSTTLDPCVAEDDPPVCVDPCTGECSDRYEPPDVPAFFCYASNVDNVTGDGEAIMAVVDWLGFANWADEYVATHCPENAAPSSLPQVVRIAERMGLPIGSHAPPTLRKVVE